MNRRLHAHPLNPQVLNATRCLVETALRLRVRRDCPNVLMYGSASVEGLEVDGDRVRGGSGPMPGQGVLERGPRHRGPMDGLPQNICTLFLESRKRSAKARGCPKRPLRSCTGLGLPPPAPPGVRLKSGAVVGADLVVDAMGRGSRTPEWLGDAGWTPPPTLTVNANLVRGFPCMVAGKVSPPPTHPHKQFIHARVASHCQVHTSAMFELSQSYTGPSTVEVRS